MLENYDTYASDGEYYLNFIAHLHKIYKENLESKLNASAKINPPFEISAWPTENVLDYLERLFELFNTHHRKMTRPARQNLTSIFKRTPSGSAPHSRESSSSTGFLLFNNLKTKNKAPFSRLQDSPPNENNNPLNIFTYKTKSNTSTADEISLKSLFRNIAPPPYQLSFAHDHYSYKDKFKQCIECAQNVRIVTLLTAITKDDSCVEKNMQEMKKHITCTEQNPTEVLGDSTSSPTQSKSILARLCDWFKSFFSWLASAFQCCGGREESFPPAHSAQF